MTSELQTDSRLVLSNYPLSASYKAKLQEKIGGVPAYLNVSELRQTSLRGMIHRLRRARAELTYVAFEDESGGALLPVLRVLAAIVRSPTLYSIDHTLEIRRFSRITALGSCVALAFESARALLAVGLAALNLRELMRAAPTRPTAPWVPRVAYLNCNLWFGVKAGGSIGHISGVVNALSGLGCDVDFFSVGGRLMVNDRARYVPLVSPRMLAMPFEATQYRYDRSCVAQIRKTLDGRAPGFLYQRMSLGNYTGVRVSREMGVPLICEYNGSEAWVATHWGRPLKFHRLAVLAEDVMLRHTHLVVTISDVLRDELIQRGVDPNRIVSYPNCIDPDLFDPARFDHDAIAALRARYGIPADALVATFVGTFGQWHGVEVLAQAIQLMMEKHSEWLAQARVRFLLIGDGARMAKVREILTHGLCARFVVIAGLIPQADAPGHLAASDVLFSPHVGNPDGTRFFGSPTKLFEYMAMGRAIIASDLDQIGDVLRDSLRVESLPDDEPLADDSRRAVLVRPGGVEDLVTAFKFLVERRAWREVLGRNARLLALERFTWRRHVREILAGLDRALASPPGVRRRVL